MSYYYLLVFCILAVFAVLELLPNVSIRSKRIMTFMSCLILCLTAGLKYETGVDWATYEAIFSLQWPIGKVLDYGVGEFFSQFGFEPGYMVLTATVKQLGGSIQWVYFIIALINIVLLYKTATYYTSHPVLVFLGYYCFVFFILDMSGVRQALAVNILLYGTRYAIDRRFWHYLMWVVLAMLFHQTALFFLILYPLFGQQRLPMGRWLIIYFCSIVVLILRIRWLEAATMFLLPYLNVGNVGQKMAQYVFSMESSDAYLNLVKVLVVASILLTCYMWRRSQLLANARSRFAVLSLFVFGVINNLMFELSEINTRITAYLIVFLAIVIADLIDRLYIETNKKMIGLTFILYCFLYAKVYLLEAPSTIPYHPYQNYVVYKMFDIESTGEERRTIFENR